MSQAQISQTSFNGGAISPLAEGRRDIPAYAASVRTLKNFLPLPMGPAMRRQGTRFVAEVADSMKASRLIPFVFSNEQSYILELSDLKIRIFSPAGLGGYVIPKERSFSSGTGVIDVATETIRFLFAHYFADESGPYRLFNDVGGSSPTPGGLTRETVDYYVNWKSPCALGLSTTKGGPDVNLTSAGTGTHTLVPWRSDDMPPTVSAPSTVIQELASPFAEADLFDIDFKQQADLLYFAHRDYEPRVLERRDTSSFRFRTVGFRDGPYDPINGTATTLDPEDLATEAPTKLLQFNQYDVFINTQVPANTIVIPEHGLTDGEGPFELDDRGSGGTLPTIDGIATGAAFWVIRTDKDSFRVAGSLALAVAGTAKDITAAGATTAYMSGFTDKKGEFSTNILDFTTGANDSRDVRRLWRYREGLADGEQSFAPQWSWGITSELTTPDKVDIALVAGRPYTDGAAENPATVVWRLGAFWSASTAYPLANYPARVFFHEQRLWYANTRTEPVTFWGSQAADFENFSPDEGVDDLTDLKRTVTDASGLTYTLAAGDQNAIQWMAASRNLLIATSGAIWSVQGAQLRESIKPSSINAVPSNSAGASSVRPVVVADEVVYLSRSGRKVMSVGFEFERDGYVPKELSQIAGHLLLNPVIEFAYAIEPYGIIWAVRDDGGLVGCTYSREQEVLAWHEYTPGGNLDGGDPQVESIATVNDFDDKYDVLWMVVKRTIESNTVRYIEFLVRDFDLDDLAEDAHFVDCSPAPYSGAAFNGPFLGFDHLDGETIDVLADGIYYLDIPVTAGQIMLPEGVEASKLIGGLRYESRLETLPLELRNAPGGTLIGRQKRAVDLYAEVNRTSNLRVGFHQDGGEIQFDEFLFSGVTDLMGEPVPLHTGLIQIDPPSDWELPGVMVFVADKPVSCTINSIVGRVEWSERGGGTG